MNYCQNCGHSLSKDSNFCSSCGTAVNSNHSDNSQRKTVYEGELHKCPNCGELVESFKSHCSLCGYEFRNTNSNSSIKELSIKLEKIESQKLPHIKRQSSIIKDILGLDFGADDVDEAQYQFEKQKEQEKANLILNFAVPNTQEDILEFMLLVSANIDITKDLSNAVTEAWILKLEQIYAKAQLSMEDTPYFARINKIYHTKKLQIRIRKFGMPILSASFYAVLFLILGLIHNPIITIGISIVILALMFLGYKLFKKYFK